MRLLKGLPISRGIGIGKAVVLREEGRKVIRSFIPSSEVKRELERLNKAVMRAVAQLKTAMRKVDPEKFRDLYLILNTHLMIAEDKSLRGRAEELIKTEKINAEWAVEKVVDELKSSFSLVKDRYLRERISDIDIVAQRVLGNLSGKRRRKMELPHSAVIISPSLSPADFVYFPKKGLGGIAIEVGSYTSHIAIIARALNIPSVFGVSGLSKKVRDGDLIIVDGYTGDVYINPSKEIVRKYEKMLESFSVEELTEAKEVIPFTRDGLRIYVKANLEMLDEIEDVKKVGADGIGIYRTEFFFKEHRSVPSEIVQYRHYLKLLERAYPLPVNIRTVDIGIEDIEDIQEKNPALGLRAIRLITTNKELLKTQLRSVLKAGSVKGNCRILFPMITTLQELREIKALLKDCRNELKNSGIAVKNLPIGIMIETPSACVVSDMLAREVNFISVGTNDLIQYTLAIDRMNEFVAHLYNPLHPSVLRIIKLAIDGAKQEGSEIEVCGEIAGDPFYIPVLLGMGVSVVSMIPSAIPQAKRVIKRVKVKEMERIVDEIMKEKTAQKVEERLKRYYRKRRVLE